MQETVVVAEVEIVRVVAAREQASPVLGVTREEKDTVPVNPAMLATVIVETALAPDSTLTLVGLAVTMKS